MKRVFALAIGGTVLSAQTEQSACEDCAQEGLTMTTIRRLAVVSGVFLTPLVAQPAQNVLVDGVGKVTIEPARAPVTIRPGNPALSALHLAHKPSKAARAAFSQGVRAERQKMPDTARQYLTKAVILDPQYVEAHAQLGVLYGELRQAPAALEQFEIALALEPNSGELHTDRAWCLMLLKRAPEAEREARRALQLQPRAAEAHYLLALSLLEQDIATAETAEHLRIASDEYEDARKVLALLKENFLEAFKDH